MIKNRRVAWSQTQSIIHVSSNNSKLYTVYDLPALHIHLNYLFTAEAQSNVTILTGPILEAHILELFSETSFQFKKAGFKLDRYKNKVWTIPRSETKGTNFRGAVKTRQGRNTTWGEKGKMAMRDEKVNSTCQREAYCSCFCARCDKTDTNTLQVGRKWHQRCSHKMKTSVRKREAWIALPVAWNLCNANLLGFNVLAIFRPQFNSGVNTPKPLIFSFKSVHVLLCWVLHK